MIPHLHPHAGDCEHACCLKIEQLSVHIGGETILDNIDLHMHCGQMVALIGPNGAGKSTLIRAILGQREYEGKITFHEASGKEAKLRIGYVPQISQLMRKRTIEENLAMASMIGRGRRKVPMEERIRKALCMVGLKDVEKRYPVELSLGECRRVELARAIINSPSVLVLDELTASLDEDTIWDLFHLIGELNRLGTTVIMATHAKNFVNLMRKRVITLVDGRIFGDVRNGRYGDVM